MTIKSPQLTNQVFGVCRPRLLLLHILLYWTLNNLSYNPYDYTDPLNFIALVGTLQ